MAIFRGDHLLLINNWCALLWGRLFLIQNSLVACSFMQDWGCDFSEKAWTGLCGSLEEEKREENYIIICYNFTNKKPLQMTPMAA